MHIANQSSVIYLLLLNSKIIWGFINGTKCSTVCTRDYKPVCAHNGRVHQTFSNNCELENHNCEKTNDIYRHRFNGKCEHLEGLKCEHYCPLNSEPICGFNGRTHREFTNLCYLERFNCLEDDVFVPRFNGGCWNYDCTEDLCPYIYEPICAHDGVTHRTFSNKCFMDRYNCRRNFFLMEKKFEGECGDLFEGKKCDENCYPVNKPICAYTGSNYQEFANECSLRLHACHNGYNLLEFSSGECKQRTL